MPLNVLMSATRLLGQTILHQLKSDKKWTQGVMAELQRSADVTISRIQAIPGLKIISEPQGAMYVLVGISDSTYPGEYGNFSGKKSAKHSLHMRAVNLREHKIVLSVTFMLATANVLMLAQGNALELVVDVGWHAGLSDDVVFAQRLMEEESVVVLPGKCFRAPGTFRICFAAPIAMIEEACDRLADFCQRLSVSPPGTPFAGLSPDHL